MGFSANTRDIDGKGKWYLCPVFKTLHISLVICWFSWYKITFGTENIALMKWHLYFSFLNCHNCFNPFPRWGVAKYMDAPSCGGGNRHLLWSLMAFEFVLPPLMQHCSRAFVLPELAAWWWRSWAAVTSFTPSRGNGPESDSVITRVWTWWRVSVALTIGGLVFQRAAVSKEAKKV